MPLTPSSFIEPLFEVALLNLLTNRERQIMNSLYVLQTSEQDTATASELNWWIAYGLKKIAIAESELIHGEITENQYQTIVSTYTKQQAEFEAVMA